MLRKTKLYCSNCRASTWHVYVDAESVMCCGDFRLKLPGCGTKIRVGKNAAERR